MDCIVNVTQNWGIGKDGGLLVSISADLRRFRALTTGKTVIYGRKTLLTFPHARPLPNRENWILSATPGFSVPGAAVFPSLAALQEALRPRPADSLCLIGGASVNKASIANVIIGTFLYQGLVTMTPTVINSLIHLDISEIIRIIVSNGMIVYALTRKMGGKK